jgi:hypothetical protein
MSEWTPTQARMLKVLSDGMPHHRDELKACLHDELGSVSNIKAHLTAIRARLRRSGQDIVCQFHNGRYYYRHVVLLAND